MSSVTNVNSNHLAYTLIDTLLNQKDFETATKIGEALFNTDKFEALPDSSLKGEIKIVRLLLNTFTNDQTFISRIKTETDKRIYALNKFMGEYQELIDDALFLIPINNEEDVTHAIKSLESMITSGMVYTPPEHMKEFLNDIVEFFTSPEMYAAPAKTEEFLKIVHDKIVEKIQLLKTPQGVQEHLNRAEQRKERLARVTAMPSRPNETTQNTNNVAQSNLDHLETINQTLRNLAVGQLQDEVEQNYIDPHTPILQIIERQRDTFLQNFVERQITNLLTRNIQRINPTVINQPIGGSASNIVNSINNIAMGVFGLNNNRSENPVQNNTARQDSDDEMEDIYE